MASLTAAERALRRRIDRLEPALRASVSAALDKLQARVSIKAIADAVASGNQFTLERLFVQFAQDLREAGQVLVRVFFTTYKATVNGLPVAIRASLALTNADAVRAAQTQAARLVTGVTVETKSAIQAVIRRAFADGITPADTAKLIRPLIGLTERQATAVLNQRARDLAKGLSKDAAAKRASAYADRLLRQRATLIARTEIMRASNQGQLDIWQKAQRQGLLGPNAQKQWLVTPDDRLCPICQSVSGQVRPLNEPFHVGRQLVQAPPAHPRCRCALTLKVATAALRRTA